jgi:hypothetical protein
VISIFPWLKIGVDNRILCWRYCFRRAVHDTRLVIITRTAMYGGWHNTSRTIGRCYGPIQHFLKSTCHEYWRYWNQSSQTLHWGRTQNRRNTKEQQNALTGVYRCREISFLTCERFSVFTISSLNILILDWCILLRYYQWENKKHLCSQLCSRDLYFGTCHIIFTTCFGPHGPSSAIMYIKMLKDCCM